MKALGIMAGALGIVMMMFSCTMDVSVSTPYGSRVNNLGLMQQQSMLVNVSLGLMLIGVVLWIAARRKVVDPKDYATPSAPTSDELKDLDVLLADKGWTGIALRADDPRVVHSVTAGSVADSVGVRAGDRLIQIDGSFTGADLRQNVILLSGDPGTVASLTLRRGDQAIEVEVDREGSDDRIPSRTHVDPSSEQSSRAKAPSDQGQEGYGAWLYVAIFAFGLVLLYLRLS
ncbi:PDZ domain-containing protein [Stenotrophomonas sp. C3(2023)]|uniref:PDZ domain-containing protein n=1 Tax=Stenotrophomonas sp. C3(2023) TaxID=3080277 RepID=UPI00293CD3AA|nr:PDZ domain-containing protein [Stenotrophomonas sp. C3(2023)]MDV3469041.1 PDZ domain-containing protein [Stenotrophomonas sp. C3(2023)]